MSEHDKFRTPRLEGRTAIVTEARAGHRVGHGPAAGGRGFPCLHHSTKGRSVGQSRSSVPDSGVVAVAGRADNPAHRRELLGAVIEHFGRLDILANNAGFNAVNGELVDLYLGSACKIVEVKSFGTRAWRQNVSRRLCLQFAKRSASVMNLSPVTGQMLPRRIGFYGISSAAVAHLTGTLAVEMRPHIRVDFVAPAVIETRFAKALYEGNGAEVAVRHPLGRLGESNDVVAAAALLASSDAAWITGQAINLKRGNNLPPTLHDHFL